MYRTTTSFRVRYGETDQMGVVYYGNYAQFFEVGRVEAMRNLGLSYRKMEEDGVMLPVIHLEVNYKGSALYDDEITVETTINDIPQAKISFEHRIFRGEELLTTGRVDLVFMDKNRWRPIKAPDYFVTELAKHF